MARYMEWSARIYQVYLRHVAPEDIHPYSIDEVFMDITPYLQTTSLAPWEFAKRVVKEKAGGARHLYDGGHRALLSRRPG